MKTCKKDKSWLTTHTHTHSYTVQAYPVGSSQQVTPRPTCKKPCCGSAGASAGRRRPQASWTTSSLLSYGTVVPASYIGYSSGCGVGKGFQQGFSPRHCILCSLLGNCVTLLIIIIIQGLSVEGDERKEWQQVCQDNIVLCSIHHVYDHFGSYLCYNPHCLLTY